jgi:phosphatidylglycerol:prolipoprotein diacylglycerol transferase
MFYHLPTGESAPWYGIFETWNGGMSFHGGLLGVAIAMAAYCGYQRVSFLHVADAAALVTPIGLFCGRIANFINGELYGRASSVPWAMIFPRDAAGIPRHPSQLYEALLEGPVLMGLLWLARRYLHPRQGRIAALFLILYGLARFGVEFTRQPDADLGFIAWGWLTMGQLLSVALLAGGVLMYALIRPRHRAADVPAPAVTQSIARQRVSNR